MRRHPARFRRRLAARRPYPRILSRLAPIRRSQLIFLQQHCRSPPPPPWPGHQMGRTLQGGAPPAWIGRCHVRGRHRNGLTPAGIACRQEESTGGPIAPRIGLLMSLGGATQDGTLLESEEGAVTRRARHRGGCRESGMAAARGGGRGRSRCCPVGAASAGREGAAVRGRLGKSCCRKGAIAPTRKGKRREEGRLEETAAAARGQGAGIVKRRGLAGAGHR